MKTETIMSTLEKLAETVQPVGAARIAAAVVYGNDVVAFGINRKKSHPFQKKFSRHPDAIWLHAETDAVSKAMKILSLDELSRSTLYVCRVRFDDNDRVNLRRGLAKPCEGCMRCAASFDISKVCYSTEDGFDWL